MNVYWLEQTPADVPQHREWLSPFELDRLLQLRVPKRRDDWLLGRWTAKRAVAAQLALPLHSRALAEIEIRAAASGAPEVFIANQPAEVTISLSHSSGIGLCTVALAGVALGCDLELIEPHSEAFISDYFTVEEQACVSAASTVEKPELLALLWSAKESALKALHEGLRLPTRSVMVESTTLPDQSGWRPLRVRHDGQIFDGWWRRAGRMVRTVVADPTLQVPIAIAIKAPSPDSVFQCV